jgi:hypothetical protein
LQLPVKEIEKYENKCQKHIKKEVKEDKYEGLPGFVNITRIPVGIQTRRHHTDGELKKKDGKSRQTGACGSPAGGTNSGIVRHGRG